MLCRLRGDHIYEISLSTQCGGHHRLVCLYTFKGYLYIKRFKAHQIKEEKGKNGRKQLAGMIARRFYMRQNFTYILINTIF